jgi:hypothetical protein
MKRKIVELLLVAGGILSFLVGLLLAARFSMGPCAATPPNGAECVRPLLWDLLYFGGEVLIVLAVIDLLVVAAWGWRRSRRRGGNSRY